MLQLSLSLFPLFLYTKQLLLIFLSIYKISMCLYVICIDACKKNDLKNRIKLQLTEADR